MGGQGNGKAWEWEGMGMGGHGNGRAWEWEGRTAGAYSPIPLPAIPLPS